MSKERTYESRPLVAIPPSVNACFKSSTASAPLYFRQSVQAFYRFHYQI